MLVREELQALRSNDAPQRDAQARLSAMLTHWREQPLIAALSAELARYAAGEALAQLPALATLFTPDDTTADYLISRLVEQLLVHLGDQPLALMPLRHSSDQTQAALILLRHGTATFAVQAVEGAELRKRERPTSVVFSAVETVERIVCGEGEACHARLCTGADGATRIVQTRRMLRQGMISQRDGTHEAQWWQQVHGSLVSLKLQRRPVSGGLACEYRLADGALVQQAAGSSRDSRLELVAALLGRMERRDAAPLLAAMAQESGTPGMRWQVLRECLALDARTGCAALAAIAAQDTDPLAKPAARLRAQLRDQYPALAEVLPCPV